MKLLIVGEPETDYDYLVKRAKKYFLDVVTTDINKINLSIGDHMKMSVNDNEINANSILPLAGAHFDMFLSMIYSMKEKLYIPYTQESLISFQKNIVGLSMLNQIGHITPEINYSLNSDSIGSFNYYPAELTVGRKIITIENDEQLKKFAGLRQKGQSITVKSIGEENIIDCFVLDNSVRACIERSKRLKKGKIDKKFGNHISEVVNQLGSDFGQVSVCGNRIVSLSLNPDFKLYEKVAKVDVASELMIFMREKTEEKMNVLESVLEFIRRFA